MDEIDTIIQSLSPGREFLSSIEDGTISSNEVTKVRGQHPDAPLTYALLHSIHSQQLEALHLLLNEGIKPDDAVIEAAARRGNIDILAALLEQGWPVNRPLGGGKWASLLCFTVNNEQLLSWLLARGADPNALSNTGDTPLSVAVLDGSLSAVHMLLDAGGDVNKGNLLHRAVQRDPSRNDTVDVIALLISRGAQVDAVEFEYPCAYQLRHAFSRGTPMHKACSMGNLEAVRVLLEYGADPRHPRRRYGREEQYSPLDTAKTKGNRTMIALLERKLPQPSLSATHARSTNIVA